MSVSASIHFGLLTTKALCKLEHTSGTGELACDRTRTLFWFRFPGLLPSGIGCVYRATYDQPKACDVLSSKQVPPTKNNLALLRDPLLPGKNAPLICGPGGGSLRLGGWGAIVIAGWGPGSTVLWPS